MKDNVQLYDAFGELIYVLAMADGIIQEEEREVLEKILADHPWGQQIQWSFNYEAKKNNDIEDLYKKVMIVCHENGPDEEYQYLIEVLEIIAAANGDVDENEKKVINNFSSELLARLKADIADI